MNERDKYLAEYSKYPIVLPLIFRRFNESEGLIWYVNYYKSEMDNTPVEVMNFFIAPTTPSYDPQVLQQSLDSLTHGLQPTWKFEAKHIKVLGLRTAGIQFRELLVNDPPLVRYTTLKMLPYARVAEVASQLKQGEINILDYINYKTLSKTFGRKDEIVKWAQEHAKFFKPR